MLMHQFYKVSADSCPLEKQSLPAQRGCWVVLVVVLLALTLESRRYRIGGAKRDRTADPLRARQVLSQLSYSPSVRLSPLRPLSHLPSR